MAGVQVGALGDIHGDFETVRRIQRRHPAIEVWLCVGDVADGEGRYEPFPVPVHFIKGNNEGFDAIADGTLPAQVQEAAEITTTRVDPEVYVPPSPGSVVRRAQGEAARAVECWREQPVPSRQLALAHLAVRDLALDDRQSLRVASIRKVTGTPGWDMAASSVSQRTMVRRSASDIALNSTGSVSTSSFSTFN